MEKTMDEVLNAGGKNIGKRTSVVINGVGEINFVYLTDPEGNIIEIQELR